MRSIHEVFEREVGATHNRLQTPDFLFLRYDASASPVLLSMTLCAILTSHDPLHDFAEKCYALTVRNHGAIWVVVG